MNDVSVGTDRLRAWRLDQEHEASGKSGFVDLDFGRIDVRLGDYGGDKSEEARALMALLNASEGFITREHVNSLRAFFDSGLVVGEADLHNVSALLEVLESLLPPAEQ